MDVSPRYDIGSPTLVDLWVDPVSGDDGRTGRSRGEALRTVDAAWRRIPERLADDTRGRRIRLAPGKYPPDVEGQIRLASRRGSPACPVILEAADGQSSLELPALDFRNCTHLHLVDLRVVAAGNSRINSSIDNVLHFSDCEDVLVRRVTAVGLPSDGQLPGNVFKGNQCLRLYIEDCDFSGARGNTIDYVAVHYGHIVRNRLHHARSECMYVKGGSAHHLIAANEMFDSVNHGVLAGQTTGFRYMVSPWLHYEAYDIKVVNNVIHDCGGGVAVCGGYNILLAWNTCWRVGTSRDVIVVGFGGRGWGHGDITPIMQEYLDAGGWCNPQGDVQFNIPNRNVTIANNVILNPDGFESRYAHFGISGPVRTPTGSNLPPLARADDNLEIRGNVLWNGPPDKPLLDDVEGVYHLAARPTIDPAVLTAHNAINSVRPELVDPARGDFRPAPGGSLYRQKTVAMADFDWTDAPTSPPVPEGNPDNQVPFDRTGRPRTRDAPPGAYV